MGKSILNLLLLQRVCSDFKVFKELVFITYIDTHIPSDFLVYLIVEHAAQIFHTVIFSFCIAGKINYSRKITKLNTLQIAPQNIDVLMFVLKQKVVVLLPLRL